MSIWRWAEFFTDTPAGHHVSLGEGETPLVRSRRIGPEAGLGNLFFKMESGNPTGSYKDRFAAAAVSDMAAHGRSLVVGTSSGNTGSAVAAYCAAAGIRCQIAILDTTPAGKVKQMLAYGAELFKIKGMGTDPQISSRVVECLQEKAQRPEAQLLISAYTYSPAGMAGVQTLSYELNEQATAQDAGTIDHVFVQAGGGGLTVAVARGFGDLVEDGRLKASPAVHCVQPEGNNTIAGPLRDGADRARPQQCVSEISGLQVGQVIDGDLVIPACRASGGTGHVVNDESAWALQARLAREEGIFCEPAGAVGLSGALEAAERGQIARDAVIVCLVTGVGFKDPPSVDRMTADAKCSTIDVAELAAV